MTSNRHAQRSREVCRPEPGYFAVRLIRHGPRVPARICHEDGLWYAVVNGERFQAAADPAAAPRVFSIWHGGDFVTESEYDHMLNVAAWARQHARSHPAASPEKPIDLTKTPTIF